MAVHALSPRGLSREEKAGLAVAVAAHAALIGWLWLEPLGKDIQPPPERMTVSFADEVAIEATSPEPMAQAAPDVAPELGETPAQPEAQPEPAPLPPTPKVVATPLPRPVPAPVKPTTRPQAAPAAKPAPKQPAQPAAKPRQAGSRSQPAAKAGGSRLGSDFLKGIGGDTRGTAQSAPAAKAGPQVAASLSQAISRQLKPHWTAPQGAEADLLVTVLSFDLNPDGTLAGRPRVVSQSGVTDANRPQQARHAEQAIRAVQLAAPFELPAQYYSTWKHVASFRFDRRLSQ